MATMPHPDTIHFQVFYPPCCGDEWEQTLNKYSNIKLITQCVGTFLFTEPLNLLSIQSLGGFMAFLLLCFWFLVHGPGLPTKTTEFAHKGN